MKDLGTVPVLADALSGVSAFYPDGAWWTPSLMHSTDRLFEVADRMGIDDSFCPVRAMLGAFVLGDRFPMPDLLFCSTGATCDDFAAIAQRVEALGHPICWWEVPHRREPAPGEPAVRLAEGLLAPREQVELIHRELQRLQAHLEMHSGRRITETRLAGAVARANDHRRKLATLRTLVFSAEPCPLPALELMIAEMLILHHCSDAEEMPRVLEALIGEVRRRVAHREGILPAGAARLFWVNPVADLKAMNLVEDAGGRICGTDFMFTHTLDPIDTTIPPLEALARRVLADPMVGSTRQRAARILDEMERFGAEGLVLSRIPGASHCAHETEAIAEAVRLRRDVPILSVEIPSILDAAEPALRTRLEALCETVRDRRR
jgi:benzoyl-CoA reductase/2-hydroxyglutaryl-CoA dehydratase subunit BcrC/BadD/HgdB